MHNFIPNSFIKEILDRSNIIDVINTRIRLEKIGNHYYTLCPFHTEKKPSFTINSIQQYFYCFGCKINGNVIDFIMKYDHLNFRESVQELAKLIGIEIPQQYNDTIKDDIWNKKNQLYKIMSSITHIYHKNIISTHSTLAQRYLKNRNITLSMISNFEIGYSYKNWFNDSKISIKSRILIENNILIKHDKTLYDRFYNRIIFPIKNQLGQTIGFGGRSIYDTYHPKYINSPKSEIFNKSQQLYGIHKIKKNPKPKHIIVVEGYFDVISLTQFNIHNVVASLGSTVTIDQIQILFKFTNCIIYCFDGDQAGHNAAWNTLEKMLSYMYDIRMVKFIFLPSGEDPDSIIHKEKTENFKYRIKHAINILDFLFQKIFYKIDLNIIENKVQILNQIIPLIKKIPGKYLHFLFKKKIYDHLGIFIKKKQKILLNKQNILKNNNNKIKNIRILISLILQQPKLVHIIPNHLQELNQVNIPGISLFMELFKICKKHYTISTGKLIEFYRTKKTFNIIKKLISFNHMIEVKNINFVFIDLLIKIYSIILEKKYDTLIAKDRSSQLNVKEKNILWKINQTLSK